MKIEHTLTLTKRLVSQFKAQNIKTAIKVLCVVDKTLQKYISQYIFRCLDCEAPG